MSVPALPACLGVLAVQSGGDDFVEKLVKFGFLILFLLLPALRAILDKKGRAAKKEGQAPRPTPVDTRRGRTLWEMLEQGEAVDAPPPPVVERDTVGPVPTPVPATLPTDTGWSVEPVYEPVVAAEEEVHAGPMTMGFEPAAAHATLGPAPQSVFESVGTEPVLDYAVAERGPGRRGKSAGAVRWRRAILVHEVLGPPVAIRQAPDPIGPAGLQ